MSAIELYSTIAIVSLVMGILYGFAIVQAYKRGFRQGRIDQFRGLVFTHRQSLTQAQIRRVYFAGRNLSHEN